MVFRTVPYLASFWGPTLAYCKLLTVLTIVGLVAYILPSRGWLLTTLACAWIPVILCAVCSMHVMSRVRVSLKTRARTSLVIAAVCLMSVCALASLVPQMGPLSESGLGGEWGRKLAADTVRNLAIELVAIAGLTYVVLYRSPRLWVVRSIKHSCSMVNKFRSLIGHGIYVFCLKTIPLAGRILMRCRLSWAREEVTEQVYLETGVPRAEIKTASIGLITEDFEQVSGAGSPVRGRIWELPPATILNSSAGLRSYSEFPAKAAQIVEETFSEHGLRVDVVDISEGPSTFRIGLIPGRLTKRAKKGLEAYGGRVSVQSVLAREKDIALALQTPNLVFQSPVPGKPWIGIEVPKKRPDLVRLGAVLDITGGDGSSGLGLLPVSLGLDSENAPVRIDLTDMPHMLIAGATGSGKSACLNSIVCSLLMAKDPGQVQLLMLDPKRVGLAAYSHIPHLVTPVCSGVEQASDALSGLVNAMDDRLGALQKAGVRDISSFNRRSVRAMPYIVVIMDEVADLVIQGGARVQREIVRLSQLGRAAGIHLVLATQRPTTNVVTGLIKANITARIAFKTSSSTDSRVVLDQVGAEKLLGNGDMLLLSGQSQSPVRVQCAWVGDDEIQALAAHWDSQLENTCSVGGA